MHKEVYMRIDKLLNFVKLVTIIDKKKCGKEGQRIEINVFTKYMNFLHLFYFLCIICKLEEYFLRLLYIRCIQSFNWLGLHYILIFRVSIFF